MAISRVITQQEYHQTFDLYSREWILKIQIAANNAFGSFDCNIHSMKLAVFGNKRWEIYIGGWHTTPYHREKTALYVKEAMIKDGADVKRITIKPNPYYSSELIVRCPRVD